MCVVYEIMGTDTELKFSSHGATEFKYTENLPLVLLGLSHVSLRKPFRIAALRFFMGDVLLLHVQQC